MSRWGCGFLAASDHIRHLHDCGRKFSISIVFVSICQKNRKNASFMVDPFHKKTQLCKPHGATQLTSIGCASGMPSWDRSSLKNPSWRTDRKSNPCHNPHQTPATWRVTMDSGPGIFRKRNIRNIIEKMMVGNYRKIIHNYIIYIYIYIYYLFSYIF